MKKNVFILLLAVLIVTCFSCKKDSSEDSTTPGFSLTFQGATWTGSSYTATHLTATNSTQITAYKSGTADQIVVAYTGSATGTYTFNDSNMGSAVIGSITFSSIFSDPPVGSIVVTKYDVSKKLISGTFTFDGQTFGGTVYHITNGKFDNVPLTVY